MRCDNRLQIKTLLSPIQRGLRHSFKWVLPPMLWFFLSGQFRNNRSNEAPKAFEGGGLDMFKFKQPSSVQTPDWFYWAMGAVIIFATAGFYFMSRQKKRQEALQMKKVADEKAHLRLDVLLSKLSVILPERKLLEKLANATHPDDVLPLVESVEDFEKKVEIFKKEAKPDPKVLRNIYHLRHKLGFDVLNKRVNFITTQMLTGGIKLECKIPHPQKSILFVSPILNVTENGILLKPPTIKKKPVNLKKYPHLICRIRREDEADYEFQLPIKNQLFGKPNAIVLGHTKDIKKLFIREFERVTVDIFTTFYVMTEEQLNEMGTGVTAGKSDLALNTINGRIVDMSAGGFKAVCETVPPNLELGDIFIFHLQGANLREDLKAQVLHFGKKEEGYDVNFQFFRTRELERLKIKKFIHRMEKKAASAATPTEKKTAPPNVHAAEELVPPAPKANQAISSNERNALLQ